MAQADILALADVLKKLPKVRSKWPLQVHLRRKTQFTLRDGDKPIGFIQLDAGTTVTILDITVKNLLVRIGATESPLPVTRTDLIERMGGIAKILAYPDDPVPTPTPPPAADPSSPPTPPPGKP